MTTRFRLACASMSALLIGFLPSPVAAAHVTVAPMASTVGCMATPVGTANLPPDDPEPIHPIWCSPLATTAPVTGASDGHGGWIDSFDNGVSGNSPANIPSSIYSIQDSVAAGGDSQSQHWTMNEYWGSDVAKITGLQGSDLSPNQTVHFENGVLVLEADFAGSVPGFINSSRGDEAWGEVVASTSQPLDSGNTVDALYSYGYHRGHWTFGCRIQAARSLTCAVEADHDLSSTTGDQFPCFSTTPARVMEISGHQQCGTTHSGFSVDFGAPSNAWRQCPAGTVDPCLDRFRFEWRQNGFVAYVNGIKFAEDSGWAIESQLPASIVDGSTPLYAHYADWGDGQNGLVYRYHWARIAAQPHNPDGTLMAPSATCQFLGNCSGPSPTPTPSPTATPSPTPSVTPSPSPSPSPSASPTPFPCTLNSTPTGRIRGTCTPLGNGRYIFQQS